MNKRVEEFWNSLSPVWEELGLRMSSDLLLSFQSFHRELVEANQRVNLTRILSRQDFALKHLIDSLLIVWALEQVSYRACPESILDFGTGGGIPGIPLKLYYADLDGKKGNGLLRLVDARAKKLKQIEIMCQNLGLSAVETIHENWNPKLTRKRKQLRSELVTARAVGRVGDLIEILAPLVGKFLVLPRGPELEEEDLGAYARLAKRNGLSTMQHLKRFQALGDQEMMRHFLIFSK